MSYISDEQFNINSIGAHLGKNKENNRDDSNLKIKK